MSGSLVPQLLNVAVWTALAFAAGWWHRRTPVDQLYSDGFVLRLRSFERAGEWYERRLRVKSWKARLPETGARGGGMSKRALPGRSRGDLVRFAAECRRGERTHWTIVASSPTFLLWNSPDGVIVITAANAIGNAPFLATLRYNRARIVAILDRPDRSGASDLVTDARPVVSRGPATLLRDDEGRCGHPGPTLRAPA